MNARLLPYLTSPHLHVSLARINEEKGANTAALVAGTISRAAAIERHRRLDARFKATLRELNAHIAEGTAIRARQFPKRPPTEAEIRDLLQKYQNYAEFTREGLADGTIKLADARRLIREIDAVLAKAKADLIEAKEAANSKS